MKVNIGPYKNWIGPFQIASALCFWAKPVVDEHGLKSEPAWVYEFGTWLGTDKDGNDNTLTKICRWIDKKRKRKIKIHIDRWDTWNMDSTLSMIILPMLKQLQATKHGSAYVDLEDVPENLRYNETEDFDSQLTFDFYNSPEYVKIDCDVHSRWNWVLSEMIWAFEQKQPDCDWEDQYSTGVMDTLLLPVDKDGNKVGEPHRFNDKNYDKAEYYQMIDGPNHTRVTDYEGIRKHQERIDNGVRLFGKYFSGLWD